jgi:hypothetical protein
MITAIRNISLSSDNWFAPNFQLPNTGKAPFFPLKGSQIFQNLPPRRRQIEAE